MVVSLVVLVVRQDHFARAARARGPQTRENELATRFFATQRGGGRGGEGDLEHVWVVEVARLGHGGHAVLACGCMMARGWPCGLPMAPDHARQQTTGACRREQEQAGVAGAGVRRSRAWGHWPWMLPETDPHVFCMSPSVRHRLATSPIHCPHPPGSLQYSMLVTM